MAIIATSPETIALQFISNSGDHHRRNHHRLLLLRKIPPTSSLLWARKLRHFIDSGVYLGSEALMGIFFRILKSPALVGRAQHTASLLSIKWCSAARFLFFRLRVFDLGSVNQATFLPYGKSQMEFYADDLVPWLENQTSNLATGSASALLTIAMDALVPSSNTHLQTLRPAANGFVVHPNRN
ncbi:unnamed protein product [Lactuca saligna]|uniref:Uncharacterized protein n=1 Tax=Lactuca saligna TaxID=75948 RepID=A0AA35ZZM9_LACSI|nr:unnamed protein product [Lactuca saligna]